ncbi:MAG: cytochrome c oxidase subunit II [Leptolyngbyaceae cyanobacterium]
MKDIPASVWTLIAGVLVTLISVWVGQHHGMLPEQASTQAPMVDALFNVMVTIGTALFILVQGAIVLFAVKYRWRNNEPGDGSPLEGNIPLEILWTAIPAIIVIGLGVYSVDVYERMGGFDAALPGGMVVHNHSAGHPTMAEVTPGSAIAAPLPLVADADVAPAETSPDVAQLSQEAAPSESSKPQVFGVGALPKEIGKTPDLTVNVTGVQFAWLFNYPDSGITSGELHIPADQDVKLNLSAQDVIHSFWIPQFRLKQDALPGQMAELRFIATKPGTYPIVCTELCGSYHGSMRTQVIVHPPEEFNTWLQENKIAQSTAASQTIAVNSRQLSDQDFLAPYGRELGVDTTALAHLQHHS